MEPRDISRILSEYHNSVARLTGLENEANQGACDVYDMASDAAVDLLAGAGLMPEDTDELDLEVSDDVQTLLTLALFRCPELLVHLQNLEVVS